MESWNLPQTVVLSNPNFNKPQKIDLVIGCGLFWSILRPRRLVLRPELPIMQETELGWLIAGPMPSSNAASHETLNAIHKNPAEEDSLKKLVQRFREVDILTDQNEYLSPFDSYPARITPREIEKFDHWLHGPSFVIRTDLDWLPEFVVSDAVKQPSEHHNKEFVLVSDNIADVTSTIQFSVDFRDIRRSFAYVLRFIDTCRARIESNRTSGNSASVFVDYTRIPCLTIEEEIFADLAFIKSIQAFARECFVHENGLRTPEDSKIVHLSPSFGSEIGSPKSHCFLTHATKSFF